MGLCHQKTNKCYSTSLFVCKNERYKFGWRYLLTYIELLTPIGRYHGSPTFYRALALEAHIGQDRTPQAYSQPTARIILYH